MGGTAEPVRWQAPDGQEIEGLLCVPDGPGPHPLIVHVHGGPVWAYRDRWSMGYVYTPLLVSRGYAVLHPNPRGSGGRGQDFARAVLGDMGGADTYDYLSGIDAMVERGIADPARIGVTGGSYGGFMSAWLITQDQRFAAGRADGAEHQLVLPAPHVQHPASSTRCSWPTSRAPAAASSLTAAR